MFSNPFTQRLGSLSDILFVTDFALNEVDYPRALAVHWLSMRFHDEAASVGFASNEIARVVYPFA